MRRRQFVGGVAALAAAWPLPCRAYVGRLASGELLEALAGLMAVEQGSGPVTVHLLVSPGCDHSSLMWEAVQARLGAARYRWIPFPGAASDLSAVARAIDAGTPAALYDVISGKGTPYAPSAVATEMARVQDEAVQGRVARLAWDATARPLAAPSLAYLSDGGPMLVRGSIPTRLLDVVLADAAAQKT